MVTHSAPSNTLPLPLTLALVIVVILLDLWVAKHFLDDLYQPERRVAGGDKSVWAAIIVFGSILGMLACVLVGRESLHCDQTGSDRTGLHLTCSHRLPAPYVPVRMRKPSEQMGVVHRGLSPAE